MNRDEDADPDDCSEQELPRPTARVRFMQENHRTNSNDDIASDTITLELVNTYRDQARQLRTQVRRLQRENDDFRTQLDKLSARLEEEATVQSRKKDTTAENLQKQLGEMRLELEAKSAELEAKSVELEAKSAELEAKSVELEESQRHKDNLVSQLKEKATEQQSVSATPSSNALAFFVSQLTEKSAEVTKARQENERLQQASNRMQQENGALLEMTKRLRDEVANASKLIADFERQKVAWQVERNTDRQDDIIRLKADAERNARALEQSVTERDQKIEGMQHELDRERERVLAQAEEKEALNEKLESLRVELDCFKWTNRDSQLAAENRELLKRLSAQEKDIDSLEKQLREAKDSARSANNQKTTLEREFCNANALLDERTARLANLEQKNRQRKIKLAENRLIEATYRCQLAQMEGVIAEKEKVIDELRKATTSLTKRNEDAEKEARHTIERAQWEYASQRIEELERLTASDRGNRSEDRQKITLLERDLADARRQLENSQRRLEAAEHQVEDIRKRLIDRQREVDDLNTEKARLLSEADADKRAIEHLEEEIVKMRRAPQSRSADKAPLHPPMSAANHYGGNTDYRNPTDGQSAATALSRFTPTTNRIESDQREQPPVQRQETGQPLSVLRSWRDIWSAAKYVSSE